MTEPTPNIDPKNKGRAMYDEADIGSGERSPGQQETEELIRGIPPLPGNRQSGDDVQKQDKPGNEAQDGDAKRQAS